MTHGTHYLHEQLLALGGGEPAFEPRRGEPVYAPELPGREPGVHAVPAAPRVAGVAAVVLDCGISRREGYTHVLWISASAEAILGSQSLERLPGLIAALPGVQAWEWEGMDRLHLRAPGVDWDAMLAQAREAVVAALPR